MNHRLLASDLPQSDALRANLRLTAVGEITIDPRFAILKEPVARLVGLSASLDKLLRELNHPYRNWEWVLPDVRGFFIKNINHYIAHPLGPQCVAVVARVFLDVLEENSKFSIQVIALECCAAFLEKTLDRLPKAGLARYEETLNTLFTRISRLSDHQLLALSKSYVSLKRVLQLLLTKGGSEREDFLPRFALSCQVSLAMRSLELTYQYWLDQEDPLSFAEQGDEGVFAAISHHAISQWEGRLEGLANQPPSYGLLWQLLEFPFFLDIVAGFRQACQELGRPATGEEPAPEEILEGRKLRFLFHVMEVQGLSLIHEESLKEINRSLVHLVQLQTFEELEELLIKTFQFLRASVSSYPHTALQCIEVLGSEVFKRGNSRLMEAFLYQTVRFGFQHSSVRGVDQDWQPIFNTAHLTNIRVWLRLIAPNPKWCSTLLSALIINLRLTGTCIRDTDLFQKEVTRLLNSPISPVYNLVKQFVRRLPVFFNEIGAEGAIRDVSTQLDEARGRKDVLVHFLRKQCHVESTNLIVGFARNLLRYWRTGRTTYLAAYVTEEVLAAADRDEAEAAGLAAILGEAFRERQMTDERQFLNWPTKEMEEWVMARKGQPYIRRQRVCLLIRLYQLLNLKYYLGFQGIEIHLEEAERNGFPGVSAVRVALASGDSSRILETLLEALSGLKEVILSKETFDAREEIYQKRHIAVGIPSVFGRYQERKFDALSLSLRLEGLANIHLERLADRITEDFITRATFFRVVKYIRYFLRALEIDGISSRKLENYLEVLRRSLEISQLSFNQYLDIFQGFSEGLADIVFAYYSSHHQDNLAAIVPQLPRKALMPRYINLMDDDPSDSLERVSEALMRDVLAETFGLQPFDNFITRIRQRLMRQAVKMPGEELDRLMHYDPAKLFCPLHQPNNLTRDLIHLGNKGFNLVAMAQLGMPVPPGVILTTEFFRFREVILSYEPAWNDFDRQLHLHLRTMEEETGKGFGSTSDPLLVSVRSGALISMPGMMQTIHNVGINEEIVQGLIRRHGNAFFAWDNYRRFIQSWSMSQGVEREHFNRLMRRAKKRYGKGMKSEFTDEEMEKLAWEYHREAMNQGVHIPSDPWQQLSMAIDQVLDSWRSEKAVAYRSLMGISDDWGTAVVIQTMVYGNIHEMAGTGVLFTAHPRRKLNRVVLWGDYTPGNQGEDIVGGLVNTRAVSAEQAKEDGRNPKRSLECCFPHIHARLMALARKLVYEHRYNPQEIEFTFDGPGPDNLFLLQTRDMVATGTAVVPSFTKGSDYLAAVLGQGIGVSGGALCGLAVFDGGQVERLRRERPGVPLILIRYDTVPDDIKEISATEGLLTARGGQTSHASIVAARLGKVCVVGCESLQVGEGVELCRVGERVIQAGDEMALDGRTGVVAWGWHAVESSA